MNRRCYNPIIQNFPKNYLPVFYNQLLSNNQTLGSSEGATTVTGVSGIYSGPRHRFRLNDLSRNCFGDSEGATTPISTVTTISDNCHKRWLELEKLDNEKIKPRSAEISDFSLIFSSHCLGRR